MHPTVSCGVPMVHGNHIALQVLHEVVVLPGSAGHLVVKADGRIILVEGVPHGIPLGDLGCIPPLGYCQAIHDEILRLTAVEIGLAGSQTVHIVVKGVIPVARPQTVWSTQRGHDWRQLLCTAIRRLLVSHRQPYSLGEKSPSSG